MSTFHLLVGSVMGTAESVARHIQSLLESQQHSVHLNLHYNTGDLTQRADEFIIICTSNTGMGDVPDNLSALLSELHSSPPNIYQRPFALINLGDSSYSTFAQAGLSIDDALSDIGAIRIGEICTIDAMTDNDPMHQAEQWLALNSSDFVAAIKGFNNEN